MIRTKEFVTSWRMPLVALLLLMVLIACGGEQPTEVAIERTTAPTEPAAPTDAPTEPPPPTEMPTEPATPTNLPTEPPLATDTPTPTPVVAPTEEPTPEAVDDTACIACHTDEETLKAVAEEEGAPEVESEGEG